MQHSSCRTVLILALAVAGVHADDARAANFCVSNGSQLASALLTAQTNGQSDTIRMVEGVFTSAAGDGAVQWLFQVTETDAASSLTLIGGYDSGCSTAEPPNAPQSTQLDGQNRGTILRFATSGVEEFSGQVVLRNFTATRGRGTAGSPVPAIFFSSQNATAAARFELERSLVVASQSHVAGADGAVRIDLNAGSVRVRGNLLHDNRSTHANSLPGLSVRMGTAGFGVVSNNTIHGNVGTREGSGMVLCGPLVVANNAVADNEPSGAASSQAQVHTSTALCTSGLSLRNNHFQTYHLTGAPAADDATSVGDPHWTVTGSFPIPDGVSPLRDSGVNNPLAGLTSLDIRGNARLVNGTVDRGAVEAPVVPATGPSITPISHISDTYTDLGMAAPGSTLQTQLTFAAAGGNLGSTTMNCSSDTPVLQIVGNASQTVFAGQSVAPVALAIGPLTMGTQGGVITCVVTPQGGNASTPMFGFGATGVANFLFRDGFEAAP